MSANLVSEVESMESPKGSHKLRRGKRGSKKQRAEPISEGQQFLESAMENLSVENKRRPARKPKIPVDELLGGVSIAYQEIPEEERQWTLNNHFSSPVVQTPVPSAPSFSQSPPVNPFQYMDPAIINSLVFANSLAYVNSMIDQTSQANLGLITNTQQKAQLPQAATSRREKRGKKGNTNGSKGNHESQKTNGNFMPQQKKTNCTAGISNNNRSNQAQSEGPNSAKKKNKDNNSFLVHMSEQEIKTLLSSQKRENVEYVEGNIRINSKFFKEAYIAMAEGEADLLIDGVQDRNRALEGDLVVARVNPREKWRGVNSGKPQKTGIVVHISEKIHSRKTVGILKLMPDKNNRIALFCPRDSKVPRLNIHSNLCPKNFFENPERFADVMFLAEITDWTDVRFAIGKILDIVGKVGDLKVETNAILLENDLDVTPYGEELTEGLPSSDYVPTVADIEGREDWRNECIFTIDPITAKDLDDAVSCKVLENGNYEIGVHISDVTHYLQEFCPLDEKVSKRGTTIYLADSVHHMLPKQLCNACSLLPGVDKLAFSVVWEMTPEAEVVKHRFAKTVINSCCQMAYEHAQAMILEPDKVWNAEEWPVITGKYESSDLSRTVNILNNLAVKMRERRFKNGSLRIDQPKLHMIVDQESGFPVSYTLEEQKDSNRLIEEFMLLANMTVATQLYETLPKVSLLRSHRPPLMRIFSETQSTLQKLGVHLDISSAGNLQASLQRYQPDPNEYDAEHKFVARCRMMVINALCAKPMSRARYFCTSDKMDEETLMHYALNTPLYTHFTSPIRRYPDCVVHRLLYASIRNESPSPQWTPDLCSKIAANCNKQKFNAKKAQEQSNELFFTTLLGIMGPIDTVAVVMDVKDRSVDVILCEIGLTIRVYYAELEKEAHVKHSNEGNVQTVTLSWKQPAFIQVINIFSILNVRVGRQSTTGKLHGLILQPAVTP